MGRKKIDRRKQAAIEALSKALEDSRFIESLLVVKSSLEAYKARRLEALEQGDPTAAFPDWKWREPPTFDQGRLQYSGPYYELRELCDNYSLPWPESGEVLLRALSSPHASDLPEFPPPRAWQAWRMARKGLGRPREDEISEALKLLGSHTAHGKKRNFKRGLTHEAVAYILGVHQRTVARWVRDCQRYALIGDVNKIGRAANLSGKEQFRLLTASIAAELDK